MGWEKLHRKIPMPIIALTPVSDNLLKFIWCQCKISSKNPCKVMFAHVATNGLECVPACGDC